MSEPVTGDMREFGFSDSDPGEESREEQSRRTEEALREEGALVEEAVEEAVEAPVEATEEPAEALEEPGEGVDEAEEEIEPQALSEDEILAKVSEFYTTPSSEAEPQGLTEADISRVLDERLAGLAKPEAPAEEPQAEPGVDPDFQAFQQMYARADEEERPVLMAQFQELRERKLRQEFRQELEKREETSRHQTDLVRAQQQLRANLDSGLSAALNSGGMSAAVVREFQESGDYARLLSGQFGRSILSQALQAAPANLYSASGIVMAVYAARALIEDGYRRMREQPQPNGEPAETAPATAARTTAIPAKASPQPKKTKKPTPEEQYGEAIASAGSAYKASLPFMSEP